MSRMGRDVNLAARGTRGYLALPASGTGPGVLVIQEWWGLVEQIRDVCDRLAREGFVALAPDLYRGESATEPSAAERLMMDLDLDRAAGDLDAAVGALLSQQGTIGARVGCIGFCMGGQLALLAATKSERIGAVVDCYGIHPNVELDASALRAPVLGIFGEHDDFVPPSVADALEHRLADAGVRVQFKTFVGVGHAFLNESRPDAYDAPSAREAWNDILTFLRAELT